MFYQIITIIIFLIFTQIIQTQDCQCPENHLQNPKTNYCLPDTPKQSDEDYQEGCKSYKINQQLDNYYCNQCKPTYYPNENMREIGLICEYTGLSNCISIIKNYDSQQINQRFLQSDYPPPSNFSIINQTKIPQYTCKDCIEGQFAKFNKCEPNPQDGEQGFIEGCHLYIFNETLKETQCLLCNGGYYEKEKTCLKNPDTPKNCFFIWDQSSQKVECKWCDYNYVKKGDQCVEITNPIQGCLEYQYNEDTLQCVDCDKRQSFVLFNATYCGNISDKIPNCAIGSYNFTTNEKKCEQCKYKFYKKNDNCEANPLAENTKDYIQHCTQYGYYDSQKSTYCKQCEGNYIEMSRQCLAPNPTIKNCGSYKYDEEANSTQCTSCTMNYTSLKFPTNKCYKCLTGEIDDGNSATILFYGLLFNLAIIIVNVI